MQALIDGGVAPAAARVIANALANANTPQFTATRDVSDQTPTEQLRLITPDARRYQLTNLDFSSEKPYQSAIESFPGQYLSDTQDHPYKDSQPVLPASPLSTPRIVSGEFVDVSESLVEGSQQTVVGLKIGRRSGAHLRANLATNSLDAVPMEISSPQGLVTADVIEGSGATTVQLQVRGLQSKSLVLHDGTTARVKLWIDSSVAAEQQMVVPAGSVVPLAGLLPASMNSAWLACDGATYSTAAYPNLFAVIAYTYGGSGTNFQVPDLRGYFIRGFGLNSDNTGSEKLGVKQADYTGTHTHNTQAADTGVGTGPYHGEMTSNLPVNIATLGPSTAVVHKEIVNAASGSQTLRVTDATNLHLGMLVGDTSVPTSPVPFITQIADAFVISDRTGTATNGGSTLTVNSVTGILLGMRITGTGIRPDTYVGSIAGSVITMRLDSTGALSTTTAALSGTAVTFSYTDVTISAATTAAITNDLADFYDIETRPKNIAMYYYIKT